MGQDTAAEDAARVAALKKADMSMKRLRDLCPKTHVMLSNITACAGKCIVYSNFKIAEGIGHVAVALEANGWAEVKVRRSPETGEWELDGGPLPPGKPRFFRYESRKEEVEVLMSIFNLGDIAARGASSQRLLPGNVPTKLLQQLGGSPAVTGKNKHVGNLRGEMIKLLMLTKSGAEGLDLKHVRQVHVMEPYWHEVRIQQVIGRAIRLRSHKDLPDAEQTVIDVTTMLMVSPWSDLNKVLIAAVICKAAAGANTPAALANGLGM